MSDPLYLDRVAVGLGGFVLYGRDEVGGLGKGVASAGDVNGDGVDDFAIRPSTGSGPDNTKPAAGEVYVVFGRAGGFEARVDLTQLNGVDGFVVYGQDSFDYLRAVASAGDVNGDGFDDLLLGAYGGDGVGNMALDAGEAYVIFGKAAGFSPVIDLASIAAGEGGFAIYGTPTSDYAGFSVASAGDFNGDGFDDLLIGALGLRAGAYDLSRDGKGYLVFGRAGGFDASIALADIEAGIGGFVIRAREDGDASSYSVASAGDFNGDGFDDLLIGAPAADGEHDHSPRAGESYLIYGAAEVPASGIDLANVAAGVGGFVIYGRDSFDGASQSGAVAGDFNGDGFDDLLIGAPGSDGADNTSFQSGEAYLVLGRAGTPGASIRLEEIAAGSGGLVIYGRDALDLAGHSVAVAGDIDGDGFDDLIIGAKYADSVSNAQDATGESYVLFGGAAGFAAAISLETIAAGIGGLVIYGKEQGDQAAFVATAGDVNGDGFDDLLIGAPGADGADNAATGAGEAYVVFGSPALRGGPVPCTDDRADLRGAGGGSISAGCGDDTYLVDDPLDVPVEARGQGYDTVQASISWILAPNFEALLLGTSDTAERLYAIGNGLANEIRGNAAGNRLRGMGGDDRLAGGAGNDRITGDTGNDVLAGGLGNDTLDGSAGSDAFRFGARLSGTNNRDRINDFTPEQDRLLLDDDVFTAFSAAASTQLAAEQFYAAPGVARAHDADDRIIYNTTTGALYYDADGTGTAKAPIQFAVLGATTHPTITAADFVIVA